MLKRILLCLLIPNVAYAADIVTSIRPLYDLANQIVGEGDANNDDKVHLLLKNSNPHDAVLKPSHIRVLQQSEIIFYIDDDFEIFMKDALKAVKGDAYPLARKLDYLPQREAGRGEHHHDDHDNHDDHDEKEAIDFHLWLNPKNAIDIVALMRDALVAQNPKNAVVYQRNSARLVAKLRSLDKKLNKKLTPYRNKPFIVFHDGYQYFEKAYRLTFAGAVTVNPEQPLSPQKIRDIRNILQTQKVNCIFNEPEFISPAFDKIIGTLTDGTNINIGTLDPLGNMMEDYSYQAHLTLLADNAVQCLK